jgi:hypothetical protein
MTIEPMFEDRLDTFLCTGPEGERPLTGRCESLGAVALPQTHEPSTGPEPLLGMRP